MHHHGTAVLDNPTEVTPAGSAGMSARQRWLDRCEADFAEALATKNVYLLPVVAEVLFTDDVSDMCPDCQGTGYLQNTTFDLCYCMAGEIPAYDLPRHKRGKTIWLIGRLDDQAEVWVPCPECEIGPVKTGPYLRGRRIGSPWVPDCRKCSDTGWSLSHITTADILR